MDAKYCMSAGCGEEARFGTPEHVTFCSPACLFVWHSDAWTKRVGGHESSSTVIVPVRIARVVDGDTVVDTQGIHYRLTGIDAPERTQPGGPEATRALEAMLQTAAHVGVHGSKKDRYDRVLGTLYAARDAGFSESVENINERMVKEGWAWSYARVKPRRGPDFLDMEETARVNKRGIWAMQGVNHVLPHDYRREKREGHGSVDQRRA